MKVPKPEPLSEGKEGRRFPAIPAPAAVPCVEAQCATYGHMSFLAQSAVFRGVRRQFMQDHDKRRGEGRRQHQVRAVDRDASFTECGYAASRRFTITSISAPFHRSLQGVREPRKVRTDDLRFFIASGLVAPCKVWRTIAMMTASVFFMRCDNSPIKRDWCPSQALASLMSCKVLQAWATGPVCPLRIERLSKGSQPLVLAFARHPELTENAPSPAGSRAWLRAC